MQKKQVLLLAVGVFCGSMIFGMKANAEMPDRFQIGVAAVLNNIGGMEEMESIHPCVFEYERLGIAQVDKYLNIRSGPGTDYKVVGKLPDEAACEILTIEDGWAQIISGEVEGYVSEEFLLQGMDAILAADSYVSTMVKVSADALKVRKEPNTESEVVTMVGMGDDLEMVDANIDGWVKVLLDGDEYYVSADYVEVEDTLKTAITLSELLYGEGVSDVRVDICEYAKQFLGNPYVYGGTSLTNGADCSGFIMKIFAHFNVSLPHSSRMQATYGEAITRDELQPGDLLFYKEDGVIGHVTMYIGGGKVIHASSPSTGIRISDIGYRTPCSYRRILE